MKKDNKLTFAFDVGIGSLGVALRKGNEIIYSDSLLIDPGLGGMKDERERRRAHRTRQAHQNREECLVDLWKQVGETPLLGGRYFKNTEGKLDWESGDERLEREFPAKDDKTVYTSSLLRILLLEGCKTLAPWQIFKALHSAIQRRGYDHAVPWRKSEENQPKEEAESQTKAGEFQKKIQKITSNPKQHFPCYYDAYRMGLWKPKKGIVKHRIDNKARSVRSKDTSYTAPREMVDREIRELLKQAGKLLPELNKRIDSEDKINLLLYGEDNKKTPAKDRRYPSAKQTHGLLSQKLPRFDNRAVGKCSLIPRFHVCRKSDGLFIRVNFLLGLLNFRYEKTTNGNIVLHSLNSGETKRIYDDKDGKWKKKNSNSIPQTKNCRKKERKFFV